MRAGGCEFLLVLCQGGVLFIVALKNKRDSEHKNVGNGVRDLFTIFFLIFALLKEDVDIKIRSAWREVREGVKPQYRRLIFIVKT